jgi:acyl-CoA thioester hydrolase
MQTGPLLSHRGYVNTWECDDRGHLNVQFYPDRFADASVHAMNALGLGPRAARAAGLGFRLAQEHITFQRELRASDSISVHTGILAADRTGLILLHELVDSVGAHIAATSTQRFDLVQGAMPDGALEAAAKVTIDLPHHARPRSVGHEPPPILTLDAPGTEGLVEIRRGVVHAADCDAEGHLRMRHLHGQFSDGAGHLWEAMGLPRGKMVDRGFGSVVVELLLRPIRPVPVGSLIVIRSGVRAVAGKAIRVNHFMFDAETRETLATSDVTALLMDLETRRAVALPDDVREQVSRMIVPES